MAGELQYLLDGKQGVISALNSVRSVTTIWQIKRKSRTQVSLRSNYCLCSSLSSLTQGAILCMVNQSTLFWAAIKALIQQNVSAQLRFEHT